MFTRRQYFRLKFQLLLVFTSLLLLASCVGSDTVDEIEVGAMIQIDSAATALVVGNTLQLTATYYDEFGHEQEVALKWLSDSDHATVSEDGLVTAVTKGTARIYAKFGDVLSPSHDITVVEDPNAIASVRVLSPKSNLEVGEKIQLIAEARNLNGSLVQIDAPVTWVSSSPGTISVDAEGLATAHVNGGAEITATVEGVKSKPLMLSVGEQQVRTGTFVGSGYTAEGTAMLAYNESSELILTFSSDFKTSFALGTFIYLSNSTSGGTTASSGLELGEITTNGAKTFNVSQVNGSVTLDTYKYVIILCKPASITFGYAELKP